jgi:hypothetical protein
MFLKCKSGADAIATAALNGKFAIYELDFQVLSDCVDLGFFNKLRYGADYVLISENMNLIGKAYQHRDITIGPIAGFDIVEVFPFESVVILEKNRPHKLFEKISDLGTISPNNIFMDPEAWRNRSYQNEELLRNALDRTELVGGGGLSSEELLVHIIDCMLLIKKNNIPGDIINFGVYKGWSMQFFAEVRDSLGLQEKRIWGFDTFEGFTDTSSSIFDSFIPYANEHDGSGLTIHKDTSYEAVEERLSIYNNIKLVKGDINKTISLIENVQTSIVLFDMDDYTPTKISLPTAYSSLSKNGFIIHDHYSFPSCGNPGLYGQRRAMQDFLKDRPMFNLAGTNVFMKV